MLRQVQRSGRGSTTVNLQARQQKEGGLGQAVSVRDRGVKGGSAMRESQGWGERQKMEAGGWGEHGMKSGRARLMEKADKDM